MAEVMTAAPRRVGLTEIAQQMGMSRTLLHYYLGQIKRKPRRDEITGTGYFLEQEVAVLIGELETYRNRRKHD